jgi:hypothetical protein
MKITTLALLLVFAKAQAEAPRPKAEEIWCRGVIEEFVKEGIRLDPAWPDLHDITWVRVKEPKKYAEVRIPLYTPAPNDSSPIGKIGELIRFSSYKHLLEEAKKKKEVQNQPSHPTRSARG